MKWVGVIAILCLALTGCAQNDSLYTPLPFSDDDGTWDVVGKVFVNGVTWTGEVLLVVAFYATLLWLQAGAPR
jgi:hypothetical protein